MFWLGSLPTCIFLLVSGFAFSFGSFEAFRARFALLHRSAGVNPSVDGEHHPAVCFAACFPVIFGVLDCVLA